MYGAIFTGKKY